MQAESQKPETRKRALAATVLVVMLLVAGVLVLNKGNTFSEASKKVNVESKQAPIILNEDMNPRVEPDSCWWPTCKAADCNGKPGGQQACVNRCQQHGLAACKGKCCQIGANPVSRSSNNECNTLCGQGNCGSDCATRVRCYEACSRGDDCKAKGICCGCRPQPPPPGGSGGWYTIGGTTTDQWCTNNCPNSKNPHCGDGIWCCGGSTHSKQYCLKIREDRKRLCGSYCYSNCFYLDHQGVCSTCPTNHWCCKRKLW